MKGTCKNRDEFVSLKDMAICTNPKEYYVYMKMYKRAWRKDPWTEVLLGNLLHLNINNPTKSGKKT
jgi:hypothetical protein